MNVLSFFLISSRYPYMTSLYFSALVLTFSAISVCIFLFFASYCLIAGSRFIDLFHCIYFKNVSDLYVVELFKSDAAFKALCDFLYVVLETAQ